MVTGKNGRKYVIYVKIKEAGDNHRMEILTKKLQVINKMENIPLELPDVSSKLAYGDSEFVNVI